MIKASVSITALLLARKGVKEHICIYIIMLQMRIEENCELPDRSEVNRVHRFCKRHTDYPKAPELYELYRAAEVFTAAFDCGKLLCCDEDQHLPWSTPMVLELIQSTVTILQAEGYPAEIPTSFIDDH